MRMKLPDMLSGDAIPWHTVQRRMVLNGEKCSSVVADESLSVTIRLDASIVDPCASGPQNVPFALSVLRCKAIGDMVRGRRLELIERSSLTSTSDQFVVSPFVLPVAAKTGAGQASNTGAPDTSMERCLMMSMHCSQGCTAWTSSSFHRSVWCTRGWLQCMDIIKHLCTHGLGRRGLGGLEERRFSKRSAACNRNSLFRLGCWRGARIPVTMLARFVSGL